MIAADPEWVGVIGIVLLGESVVGHFKGEVLGVGFAVAVWGTAYVSLACLQHPGGEGEVFD